MTSSHWPLDRVTKVFQGKDSIIRSVKIKLPNNKVIQPSVKLCLLESSIIVDRNFAILCF